jgi:hypothetical protein
MNLEQAQRHYAQGQLREVIVEPADAGNGWMVLVKRHDGESTTITDHSGVEKVFHSLAHATALAKSIGFETVRIEEQF